MLQQKHLCTFWYQLCLNVAFRNMKYSPITNVHFLFRVGIGFGEYLIFTNENIDPVGIPIVKYKRNVKSFVCVFLILLYLSFIRVNIAFLDTRIRHLSFKLYNWEHACMFSYAGRIFFLNNYGKPSSSRYIMFVVTLLKLHWNLKDAR